jgi:ribosomal protein S18 acetylase RimI-like enzyme
MIKIISVEDVLPLRSSELREGKIAPQHMRYPTDKAEGSLHLGYFIKGQLVSILSIHRQQYGQYKGEGYQMRGVATIGQYRGQGIGTKMLNFALIYLQDQNADYLWCNGRKRALKFYQRAGFEILTPEFDLPPAGPHHVLYLKLP